MKKRKEGGCKLCQNNGFNQNGNRMMRKIIGVLKLDYLEEKKERTRERGCAGVSGESRRKQQTCLRKK